MPKIRIKDHKPNHGNRKVLLWNKLMHNNLLIYKMEEPSRNFFVIISSDEVIEKLLTPKLKEVLRKDDFEVLTPPQFNANRTLVVKNVDSLITSVDPEDLKNDIERRNDWAKVTEVITIPNAPKLLKIRFENASMNKTASEKGILIYNQSFPPSSVEREIFIQLTPCLKCYKYEHRAEACPTPNVTLCSECAANDHIYRNCRSEAKKCLNCNGNHRTFAAQCPVRKQLIQEKKKAIRERSRSRSRSRSTHGNTYAQAVQSGVNNREDSIYFNRTDYVKITSSITYAHIMEGVIPGSFHENVKEMFRLNGLPEVKFPSYIPPPHIPQSEITERKKEMEKINTRKEEEAEQVEEIEVEWEVEREKRKRDEITPSPKETRDPRLNKKERQDTQQRDETPPPPPPSPERAARPSYREITDPRESTKVKESKDSVRPKVKTLTSSEEDALKKYSKMQKEMNFTFIKLRTTSLRRRDLSEVNQLLKEKKIEIVYSNPAFSEEEVRTLWERGLVDLRTADIKDVNLEFYNSIERNGQLVRPRRSSMSSSK